MKKVMILEDQRDSRDALAQIVKSVDANARIYAVGRASNAYAIAMEHSIDLFLIDIILRPDKRGGDQSGAEFAQNIRMVERYSSMHCYKFIEKPFDWDAVREVIREAMSYQTRNPEGRVVFYRTGGLLEAITITDIIYAENRQHRLKVVTENGEVRIPYRPCKEFLRELDSEDFLQCNRSTIVNRNFIERIDPANRYVYVKGRAEALEIGSVMKREFLRNIRTI